MSDRAELRNPLYRNWVRAALGLKYLQQGLAGFVSNLSDQRHQSHLYSYRKVTGSPAHSCAECTADNLLPEHPRKTCIQKYRSKCFCNSLVGRRSCPNNFCSRFYDLIVLDHDERNPVWTNTDPSCWYKDHWSFARCFLTTAGYSDKQSAADTDAAGLLSILINNVELRTSLDNVSHFEEVRNTRNDIIHSATFEIEKRRLSQILDQFVGILKDKKSLIHDPDAKQAVAKLEKLKTDEIYINSVEAEELHKNALEAIAEKKEEVLAEIDRKTFESIERITETEKQKTRAVSNALTQTVTCTNATQTEEVSGTISNLEKQELQRYLVDLYRKGYLKTDLSPLVPEEEVDLDKVYVPLKMLKRTGNKPDATPVRLLNDIFFCGNKHAKCIYVSGDAGIGKTTLCRKLISEWCHIHSTLSNRISIEGGGETDPMEMKTQNVSVNKDSNSDDISSFSEDVPIRKQSDSDDENAFLNESDDNLSDTDYSSEESDSDINTLPAAAKGYLGEVECKAYQFRESALKEFYYLFFISLRDTYKERSIEEMVCRQLLRKQSLQEIFRVVLDEEPGRCLFILDGLDEWIPPFPLPTHPTVTRGLPVSSGEDNFTKLFTSRPWKVELLRPNLSDNDLEISIHGIEKRSAECLVKNIFDTLTSNKDDVEFNTFIFLLKLKEMNIECLGSVPLLLKLLVCLSERDGELADTQLGIYSSVINKLCTLAVGRNHNNDMFESLVSQVERQNCELPPCLKKYAVCCRFSSLIHSLGRLSFETIFHNNRETALVFKDEDLTRYGITKAENELSMLIGLLSKKKVIGKSKMYPVRCVSFIHKTFQEYFAALFIAMTFEQDMTIVERARARCTTIETILDISKVLYFIKELNSSVLSRITGDIELNDKRFCLTVERNELALRTNINSSTKMVAELFLSNEIRSILVNDSNFGIHTLRFPVAMKNLESLTFDSVEMTYCAFREIIERIPNTSSGVSLTFRNIAFKKSLNQNEECQVAVISSYLRSIDFYFMNMCCLNLRFPGTLTILERVQFYMVTMNETELVELLKSIRYTNHDVIVIFDDINLRSNSSENSNILTETLTECSNLKGFSCKTKHVRSVAFRCFDNTVICKSLKLDEVAGKEYIKDKFLIYLEGNIKNHSDPTVIRIMSVEDSKTTDIHDVAPGLTTIILGCNEQYIQSFQLANITVTEKALCEILSHSKLDQLDSVHLDNINIEDTSSQEKYLHFGCDSLVIKKMNLSCMHISLSKPPSLVRLVDITLALEDFFQLLHSVKEIMGYDLILDFGSLSLIKRLDTSSIAKCGVIQKLTLKRIHFQRFSFSLQHTVMEANDLYALLQCFIHGRISEVKLDNIVITQDSCFLGHLECNNTQNVPLSNEILTFLTLPYLNYVCLINICLTVEAFHDLLICNSALTLLMNQITIANTSFSDKNVQCTGMNNLTIERTNLTNILITDVTVTENACCSLLRHHDYKRLMMLDNINITNSSDSERTLQWHNVQQLTIKRTNLANYIFSISNIETIHLEDLSLTENAFCSLLEHSGFCSVRSMFLHNITITNTSATKRPVRCDIIRGNLTIEQTDLANILMTFPFELFEIKFINITMSENAFCALLESDNVDSVVLDAITLTSISTSNRQIRCENTQGLSIIRMDLSNIVLKFHFADCRYCEILLKDIIMTDNSLRDILTSLQEDRFNVTLNLQDDSKTSSTSDSASVKHTECKTIKLMTVKLRPHLRHRQLRTRDIQF